MANYKLTRPFTKQLQRQHLRRLKLKLSAASEEFVTTTRAHSSTRIAISNGAAGMVRAPQIARHQHTRTATRPATRAQPPPPAPAPTRPPPPARRSSAQVHIGVRLHTGSEVRWHESGESGHPYIPSTLRPGAHRRAAPPRRDAHTRHPRLHLLLRPHHPHGRISSIVVIVV